MTKKMIKIVTMALLVATLVFAVLPCFAAEEPGLDVNQFNDTTGVKLEASNSVKRIITALINLVRIVGSGVAVIMLIVLAIKYISAAPGDKAEIKKHAVVYIVGAVVLFAASGILGIIQNFAANVSAS